MSRNDYLISPQVQTQRFFYIQRCWENTNPSQQATGVDRLLKFDYMGAAEFEFGALGCTFRGLRDLAKRGNLRLGSTKILRTIHGHPFWYIIPSEWDAIEFEDCLSLLGHRNLRTKEHTCMDYWVTPARDSPWREHALKTTAWVSIIQEHQVRQGRGTLPSFWCVNRETAESLFRELHS